MFNVRKQARLLSDRYYNRGLDRAQIRDLSGAIDMLQRSLQLNKRNIQARNLLGLVYFEMGEAVSALSEWVISKNLQPEGNIASGFIDKLKANQNKLALINQTIKSYNIALQNCRRGDEDVAAISLKKVVTQNPRLIKAYHLLSLIYIKQGRYTRARKLLGRAGRIDRTNPTTLRYLQEAEEQSGIAERKAGRAERASRRQTDDEEQIRTVGFRESTPLMGLFNLLLGIAIGVLAAWFLVAPTVRQTLNRQANEKVVEYSNTMAVQKDQIAELQSQVSAADTTAENNQQEVEQSEARIKSYENLIKAYQAFNENKYTEASNAFEEVDSDLLSTEAKVIYDSLYEQVKETMFTNLKMSGIEDFQAGNWQDCITKLEEAKEIDATDYYVLDCLAIAYHKTEQYDKAITMFEQIIETFPNTRRATSAENYIAYLNAEREQSGRTDGQDEAEQTGTDAAGDAQTNAGADAQTNAGAGTQANAGTDAENTAPGGMAEVE